VHRGIETGLLAFALICELAAAGIICWEIIAASEEQKRALADSRDPPLSSAMSLGAGIMTRWATDEHRRAEQATYQREATKLRGTILRQRLAFVALVVGALAGSAAGLLAVWS